MQFECTRNRYNDTFRNFLCTWFTFSRLVFQQNVIPFESFSMKNICLEFLSSSIKIFRYIIFLWPLITTYNQIWKGLKNVEFSTSLGTWHNQQRFINLVFSCWNGPLFQETRQGMGKIIGFHPANQNTLYSLLWFCYDNEIITACSRPAICPLIALVGAKVLKLAVPCLVSVLAIIDPVGLTIRFGGWQIMSALHKII